MKGEMVYQMNDAVGWELPRHICVESRNFCTTVPWVKRKKVQKIKKQYTIPKEYIIVCKQCEDYGMSYNALCRAREKGRIQGTFIDGWLCMKKQDIEDYIKNPRKRGRPPQKEKI